jgi:hypothetical protein
MHYMITNYHLPTKDPIPLLVKVRDVAKILSVSRATVHALIDSGDLDASKVGPSKKKKRIHVRVTRKSLCGFYQERFGHALNQALAITPFQP